MKKQIAKSLSLFVLTALLILLVLNYFLQVSSVKNAVVTNAHFTIAQIEDILSSNNADLDILTQSLKDEYLIKAKTVAYFLDNMQINTPEEYQDLGAMMNIDEIHLFTPDGYLYNGSVPEYYGYTFDSGEQIGFFKPMIFDKSLTLCQDVTPNTAAQDPMMYVAIWSPDGDDIVQIGIKPERILEAQEKNALSYIFASMPTSDHTTLYAINNSNGIIRGSSNETHIGDSCTTIGLTMSDLRIDRDSFNATVEGVPVLNVFSLHDDVFIGVTYEKSAINLEVFESMLIISFFCILAALLIFFALIRIIDAVILKDVERIIAAVSKIAGGALDTTVDVGTSPEFRELCSHLNHMVTSLLSTTAKMSNILEYVDAKTAVYEYKKDMRRVLSTDKLGQLLQIDRAELNRITKDKDLFEAKICEIKSHPSAESNVWVLNENTYLKIETLSLDDDSYGIIVDVTTGYLERKLLRYERDYDVMTELYNRRAFYREMDKIFDDKSILQEAAIIALDMDNLKYLNDNFGHSQGDAAIVAIANNLKSCSFPQKLISRVGGDEFMIVLYGATSKEQVLQGIATLKSIMDTTVTYVEDTVHPVHISAGYVLVNKENDYLSLIKEADDALYLAKRAGKNQFHPTPRQAK